MLANLFKSFGKKIVLSIDDLVHGWKIPTYIQGGAAYRTKEASYNIHDMMAIADRIIVTTPFLRDQLAKHFVMPTWKFACYPNLPSFNWLGKLFNPAMKIQNFKTRQNKGLRIGVISSLSHYEMGNGDKEKDDIQILVDAAKHLKDYKITNLTFVLPSNGDTKITERLSPYVKVETAPMTAIRDYPMGLMKMDLDFVVVPLQDSDFNNCKSNIKLLECAAIGVPVFVSESKAYDGFIDKEFVFLDGKTLCDKLIWAKNWSEKRYSSVITSNYMKFFDNQCDYFGTPLNGYWLENNFSLTGDTFLRYDWQGGIKPPQLKTEEDEAKEETR